jgi:hypothetical protein
MQSLLDATQPKGRRYDCKSHGLAAVGPQAIGVPIDHAARIPSPQSAIVLAQLDGALGEWPADHWPAGNRDAAFVLNVTSAWQHAADAVANVHWAREGFQSTRAFSTGGSDVNCLTEDDGPERIEAACGKPTLDRLAAL